MQAHVRGNISDVDAAAASFSVNRSTDVVEADVTAAAFCVDSSRNTGAGHATAVGFDLHLFNVARHADVEFAIKLVRPAALPVAHNPRGIPANVGADLVGVEFTAGAGF